MKTGRIHIRLDKDLADKARGVAAARGITLTTLIVQALVELIKEEEATQVEPAEQI